MRLFSGTANQNLSNEVSRILNVSLSQAEIARFDNSEIRVRITDNVKDETCLVIQPTSNPTDTHFMELVFFCDALKRSEAKKVIGIIPYFGYARQNREHRSGESVSVNVVIRFLETIGFDEIITFDLHDEATEGIFSIPFKNLSSFPLLAKSIKTYLTDSTDLSAEVPQSGTKEDLTDLAVIVSPDQGGVERAREFSNLIASKNDIAVIEKKRDLDIMHKSKALSLYGDVSGKTAVLADDIITSGGTLINAADLCLKKGAKRVLAAVSHHDFSKDAATKLQNSSIERIFTTNSIFLKEDQKFEKLQEISIAPLIAQQITNLTD